MTCDPVKTTKIIIPRVSGEGGLGLPEIPWGSAYFNSGEFSNVYIKEDMYLKGDMFIWGEVNTVNSTVLTVKDTNVVIGDAGSGNNSDAIADGGGFTLKGDTDKSILWRLSNSSWNFSDSVKISGSSLIDGSSVIEGDNYTVSDSFIGGSTITSGTSVVEGNNYTVSDSFIGGSTTTSGTSVVEGNNYTVSDSFIGGSTTTSGTSVVEGNNYTVSDSFIGGSTTTSGTSVVEGNNYTVSDSFIGGNLVVTGDFTVNGENFIVDAVTVQVEDKNIELGISSTGEESDLTADGGGITLKGDSDKTILWNNSTDSWDFSEHVGVADGKYIFSDKVKARDSAGLLLEDDGGNGIFIEDGGDVGIGTTSPSVGLEINHTDALKIPKGTTVQRPTSSTATHRGYIRYNTTTDQFEGFGAGNAWGSLGGVVDVDQDTYISAETSAGVDNDQLKFFTAGTQKAIILANGNVGIGTLSPAYRIESFGKVSNSISITSTHADTTLIQHASMFTDAAGFGKIGLFNDVGNRLVEINSNGNSFFNGGDVGIGTESPHTKLEVRGSVSIDDDGTTKGLWFGDLAESQAKGYIGGGTFAVNNLGENDFGISSSSENDLVFGVGGTEEMRITPSGNVGIGTSSPNEKLDLNGILYLRNSTAPTTTTNRLYAVGGELFWNGEDVRNARDTIGELEDTSIGTKSNGQLLIWNATSSRWVNNTLTGGNGIDVTNAAGAITITHANTGDQASVPASGRTYVRGVNLDEFGHVTSLSMGTETIINTNTTYTAGNGLGLNGTAFSVDKDLIFAGTPSIGNTLTKIEIDAVNGTRFFTWDGTVSQEETMRLKTGGHLHVEGDVLAFSSTVSDERLKENISQIKNPLEKVEKLRGVVYTWKKGSREGQEDIGVIAQEVQEVIPQIVKDHKLELGDFKGDETIYKTVDYEKLSAVLIEAVKELSARVKVLEKRQ